MEKAIKFFGQASSTAPDAAQQIQIKNLRRLLRADSKQTLACALLSVALLVGLGLNYLYGVWQADPVIGLVIVALLLREGYRTLKEERLCSCAACGGPASTPAALENPPGEKPGS